MQQTDAEEEEQDEEEDEEVKMRGDWKARKCMHAQDEHTQWRRGRTSSALSQEARTASKSFWAICTAAMLL